MSPARPLACAGAPWLFCHVPKTAGTSLRAAIEAALPAERVLRDYGPDSPFTTPTLQAALQASAPAFDVLGGHFPLDKYAAYFAPQQVVTILRRPLQQLVSHFEHYRRHKAYAGSLVEFAALRTGAGLQSHMLGGVPVQLLGLVGLTERWDDSLRLFAAATGLPLDSLWSNRNPDKADSEYPLALRDLPLPLRRAVQRDFWLYLQARRTLLARLAAQDARWPWTHGAVVHLSPTSLRGIAYRPASGTVFVPIEVRRNGQLQTILSTGLPAQWPLRFRADALSESGFAAQWTEPLQRGDVIQLRCADSGQWLDAQEWRAGAEGLNYRPAPDARCGLNA